MIRECDTHHTRAIKTGSAVNLSRKPGLDLCCDLRQHLQGVPRTCRFYIIIRTYIDFARPIVTHQIVFHMKCNNVTISNSRIIWMACFVDIYTINISHQTTFPTILVVFLYAYSRYDTWCKYFPSNRFLKNTSEYVSFLRFLAYPASTLTIHPRYKHIYLHTCALIAQRPRAVFRPFLRT